MKRFVIFMLVGPAVGYMVFLLRQLLSGKGGGWEALTLGLPFAYLFAVLPSLAMWSWDSLLFNRMRIWPRIATSAIVGYAASIAMLGWQGVARAVHLCDPIRDAQHGSGRARRAV